MTTSDRPEPGSGNILVAVDGSESAGQALAWAVREAQARETSLTVAHIYYWSGSGFGDMEAVGYLMDSLEPDSRELVESAARTARELAPHLVVDAVSRPGPPVPTLVDLARGRELVVVGSRGLGGFAGMLLGSVSTGLVANAPCSVAVVRGERLPAEDDPVVVGVDSSSGDEVLTQAFQVAHRRGCPLMAVHCWQGPSSDVRAARGRDDPADEEPWQHSIASELDQRLGQVGARFPDVQAQAVTIRGRPAAVLLEKAATAQLIVVGTRGRGELKGMLLGSTSRAMVQHAPCPVIVAR